MKENEFKLETIKQCEDQIKKQYNELLYARKRTEVWEDIIKANAIMFRNQKTPHYSQDLEDEFLAIQGKYKDEEWRCFVIISGILQLVGVQFEPQDFLGRLYMHLEVSNSHLGQYYTPSEISDLCGKLISPPSDQIKIPEDHKGFFKVYDPAVGSGSMLLGFVKENISRKDEIVLYGTDIDKYPMYMFFIHCMMWGLNGVCMHGNTLTMEEWDKWTTF